MGLMFSRRRVEAAKQIEANKAKAHAENHSKAQQENGKPDPAPKAKESKKDAADKPAAK